MMTFLSSLPITNIKYKYDVRGLFNRKHLRTFDVKPHPVTFLRFPIIKSVVTSRGGNLWKGRGTLREFSIQIHTSLLFFVVVNLDLLDFILPHWWRPLTPSLKACLISLLFSLGAGHWPGCAGCTGTCTSLKTKQIYKLIRLWKQI